MVIQDRQYVNVEPLNQRSMEIIFHCRWFKFSIWKEEEASKLNLSLYSDPSLQWAATSFIQPQASAR